MTRGKLVLCLITAIVLGLCIWGALTIESTNPLWILVYMGFTGVGCVLGGSLLVYIVDNWKKSL